MRKKRNEKYYHIRSNVFWLMIVSFILLFLGAFFRNELYEKWLRIGGQEEVVFEKISTKLGNEEEYYLCGNNVRSLMGYYRNLDTIGLISLNDWYVLEFCLKNSSDDRHNRGEENYTTSTFGNTGEIHYSSDSNFDGAMASIEVTLPEDYGVEIKELRKHLCQECLDKIMESLVFFKWKNERKEAIPLCLVDFQTLEIYSLQDWQRGCLIRNYWVEIEPVGNEITVNAYTIPHQQ